MVQQSRKRLAGLGLRSTLTIGPAVYPANALVGALALSCVISDAWPVVAFARSLFVRSAMPVRSAPPLVCHQRAASARVQRLYDSHSDSAAANSSVLA